MSKRTSTAKSKLAVAPKPVSPYVFASDNDDVIDKISHHNAPWTFFNCSHDRSLHWNEITGEIIYESEDDGMCSCLLKPGATPPAAPTT